MTPYLQDADFTLLCGDALEELRTLPDGSVHCALTSPPFFGLRDYQVDGQIGLEATPDEWVARLVAVFREVRRVLRDDGTLWVECGDSYGANTQGSPKPSADTKGHVNGWVPNSWGGGQATPIVHPTKPKDLLGQPWLLAFALRGPWYMGSIEKDADRVWLAAMVDAEGCIHIHRRKAGTDSGAKFTKKDGTTVSYERKQDTFGVMVSVSNTNRAIVERCQAIYGGKGSISTHEAGTGVQQRKQALHRWCVTADQARDLLRELYPHFVAKQHEARIALACPTKDGAKYQDAIKDLHNGRPTSVDGKPPESLWEPGFYLRQCIIWGKSNAMPESVRDRCTTAHSYILLLSKRPRYFFDAEAIAEPAEWARWGDQTVPKYEGTETASGWIQPKTKEQLAPIARRKPLVPEQTKQGVGTQGNGSSTFGQFPENGRKNARSVWTIPTSGFSEAHFATWPPALVERIIRAGTSERGVCPECGAPWVREVEREQTKEGEGYESRMERWGEDFTPAHQGGRSFQVPIRYNLSTSKTTTLGWKPSCDHGKEPVPAVCLDPFMGSGTTALVARKLGRRSIGIDLNPDYCEMAARRLQQLSLLA